MNPSRTDVPRFRHARGFTFVELVISLIVLGIAVAGVLLVFTQTVTQSADPMIREQALAITEAYLEEVVSKHFDDPDGGEQFTAGPEAGETRATFDDVWDYHGLGGAPTRPDGTNAGLAALSNYTTDVQVGNAVLNGVNAALIVVTVSHPGGISVSLESYRTDYNTW